MANFINNQKWEVTMEKAKSKGKGKGPGKKPC